MHLLKTLLPYLVLAMTVVPAKARPSSTHILERRNPDWRQRIGQISQWLRDKSGASNRERKARLALQSRFDKSMEVNIWLRYISTLPEEIQKQYEDCLDRNVCFFAFAGTTPLTQLISPLFKLRDSTISHTSFSFPPYLPLYTCSPSRKQGLSASEPRDRDDVLLICKEELQSRLGARLEGYEAFKRQVEEEQDRAMENMPDEDQGQGQDEKGGPMSQFSELRHEVPGAIKSYFAPAARKPAGGAHGGLRFNMGGRKGF